MSPLPIYAGLNFSTTASPSLTCLQWSGDGQVFFVTKNSVFIMTPNYTPIIKVPGSKAIIDSKSLSWFRTTIEIDKKQIHDCDLIIVLDWTAVVLGSLDVSLRAIAVSPNNVTKDAGCVVCVLSSDMDLTLWGPKKNRYQGEWAKIQELTSLLKDCCQGYGPQNAAAHALQAQVTSITWSSQANFGIEPAPVHDASFLAAGTRGGLLHFLRFENEMISSVVKIKVSSDWLTHLAFSPWSLVEPGRCQAQIAWGTSTGGVGLVTITQSLNSCPSTTAYGPTFNVKTRMEHQAQKVFNPDKRGLTALTWVVTVENLILVACKSGSVSLWSPGSCDLGWSGIRSLLFESQKLSVGSSPLQPVSGIYYVPHEDALIISLFDGSLHVVHKLSSEPSWAPGHGSLTSQDLSIATRTASVPAEFQGLHSNIVNRISGLAPYGHATVLWAHESFQPADFGYSYDSKRHNMLITAQLYHCPSDDVFLRELATTLSQAKTTTGQSPLCLLRPCFLYLADHPEVYQRVIRLLHSPLSIKLNLSLGNTSPRSDLATSREYRQSLTRYFFGWDPLLQLRLKLAVADFVLRSTPDCSIRVECEEIACRLFRVISQIVLRILIRHLMPLAMTLALDDVPFVLRIISQAMFSGCPPDLVAEAKKLADLVHAAVPSVLPGERLRQNTISESCPACDAEIRLQSGAHAVCTNGHSWGRCSVTSFILSTAMVRQCIGCSRKAFLPLSCNLYPDVENWLPQPAKSWIVEELLEAAIRCLFCGNSFTNML